jgi:hypothetical protein
MWQMIMCISYMSKELYLRTCRGYVNFYLEFINNKKVEEGDGTDDDVYTMHVKRIAFENL